MARSEMKCVIMIAMIMLMLVLAQANHSLPPVARDNGTGDSPCTLRCTLLCAPQLGDPKKYGVCMSICQLFCGKKTSQAAYVCTRSCTYSKLNNINTDARGVNATVNSCLKTCSNQKI